MKLTETGFKSFMLTRRQSFAIALGSWFGFVKRADAQQTSGRGRVLVAYFSRSGNTRVVAGKVARDLGAEMFEINPLEPYPEDYEATVKQAEREKQAGYEPPLKERVAEIGAYTTVYLAFPIWGETAPTVIKSFLSKHDFSGKDLVPMITHGGYGAGDILAVLAKLAPRSRLRKPFVIRMDQEKAILTEVRKWLAASDAQR